MNLGSLTLLPVAPERSRHVLLRGASSAQPCGWASPGGGAVRAGMSSAPSITRQDRSSPKEPERRSLGVASSSLPLVLLPRRFGSGLKFGLSQVVFQQEPYIKRRDDNAKSEAEFQPCGRQR